MPMHAARALFVAVLVGGFLIQPADARQTIVGVRGVPALEFGAFAGADFDGDGRPDLFVTGERADGTPHTGLYRFIEREVVEIPNASPRITAVYQRVEFPQRDVSLGSVAWADMDNDGDQDVIVTGRSLEDVTTDTQEYRIATNIYYNSSGATMIIDETTGLPPVFKSEAKPADFNGDGNMDVVIAGETDDGSSLLGVYLGNGAGSFTPAPTTFQGLTPTTLTVGDVDGDGDQDFLIGGVLAGTEPVVRLYLNDGAAGFTEAGRDLPTLYFPAAALGDLDRDGDDDLILTGGRLGPSLLRGESSYLVSEPAGFTEQSTDLPGLFNGHAGFGDYDGDSDVDVFVEGIEEITSPEGQRVIVLENIDGRPFPAFSLRSVLFGHVDWLDYDANGRLDILLSGRQGDKLVISYYEL